MEKKTNFKDLSGKAKIQYIWDYYRWPIFITIAVGAFAFSLIRHYVTYHEPVLNVIMINCTDPFNSDNSGFDEFSQTYGLDTVTEPISVSSSLYFDSDDYTHSYNELQVLSAQVAVGDQDLFFGSGDVYLDYVKEGALKDISTVISPETLEKYKENLLYYTDEETGEKYPCAIELTDNDWVRNYNYYDTCYFGVLQSSPNQQTAAQFADFLLNY